MKAFPMKAFPMKAFPMKANGMARRNCRGLSCMKPVRNIDDLQDGHRYVVIDSRDKDNAKEYICEVKNVSKDDSGKVSVDLHKVYKSSGKVAKSVVIKVSCDNFPNGSFMICEDGHSLAEFLF